MMSDRFRRLLAGTIATGLLLATAPTAALAQEAEPEQAITPAGSTPTRSTVATRSATGVSPRKRAGKLVATNKRGQLPSNIVKPAWRLILGKPAAFRDGRITWGEVKNKPAALADGAVGWGEVRNKPGGFADGKDDVGFYADVVDCGFILATFGANKHVTLRNAPRNLHYHFLAVPTTTEAAVRVTDVDYTNEDDWDLEIVVHVQNSGLDPTGCKLRYVAFDPGAAGAGPLSGLTVISSQKRK